MPNTLLKTSRGKRYIKLLLALFASLVIFTLLYLFLLLPSLRNDIYNEKKLQTAEMVAIAYSASHDLRAPQVTAFAITESALIMFTQRRSLTHFNACTLLVATRVPVSGLA